MKSPRMLIALIVAAGMSAAIGLGCFSSAVSADSDQKGKKIRRPIVAGMFYPDDRQTLRREVERSLAAADKRTFSAPIKAILAPHAGYAYCGATLGSVYKQIAGESFVYDTVALIGPSHRYPTPAASVSSADVWETPLGPVEVDVERARSIVESSSGIVFDDRAHEREHSLETQLPYLIVAAQGKPFKIVPIVTTASDPSDRKEVARALVESLADPKTLIVVSTDLSHYPPADIAEKVDRQILRATASLSPEKVVEANRTISRAGHKGLATAMCGLDAVLCLELAAKGLGITDAELISYTHSGMTSGDTDRVVGYAGMVFTGSGQAPPGEETPPVSLKLSDESKKELLRSVRSAVADAVNGRTPAEIPSDNPELQVKAGCFVTLKNKGRLRGCLGRFTSEEPLWKTAREMAAVSAVMDSRFSNDPIRPAEVPELSVEISVLSPPKEISDPLREVELGRHGIVIRDRGRSGTFLPQVATETGWTLEEFLGHCSRDKAGLGWEGWKRPSAKVFTYTADIIEEDH